MKDSSDGRFKVGKIYYDLSKQTKLKFEGESHKKGPKGAKYPSYLFTEVSKEPGTQSYTPIEKDVPKVYEDWVKPGMMSFGIALGFEEVEE